MFLCQVSRSWGRDLITNLIAREMVEEYAVNIDPCQFKPMSSKSDGESSDDSSDNTYDVNEERIGKVDW